MNTYTALTAAEGVEMPIGSLVHFTQAGHIRLVEDEERPDGQVVRKAEFVFSGCEWVDCQSGNRRDWCEDSCPCEDWHDTEHCDCEEKERAFWAGHVYWVVVF